jgi:hypothetical protein
MTQQREPRKGRPGRTTLEDTEQGFALRRKVWQEIAIAEVTDFKYEEVENDGERAHMRLTVDLMVIEGTNGFDQKIALDAALREVVFRTFPGVET